MKKILVPFVAAMIASTPALAWTHVTGTIKSLDPTTHSLTLSNGRTYTLQDSVDASKFTTGDKVTINTEMSKGKRVVNEVTKAT
jgi:Cu/Ag efflux protein CusF